MGGSAIKQESVDRPGCVSLSRFCGGLACQVPWSPPYEVAASGVGAGAGAEHGVAGPPRLPLGPRVRQILSVADILVITTLPTPHTFDSIDCTGGS